MTASSQLTLSPADEDHLHEILRLGVREADGDRPDIAERLFRGVFAATRGTGTRVERFACSCLVKIFARRNCDVEALVLARRHVRLAAALGDTESLCNAYAGLGDAFVRIEDWDNVDKAIEGFGAALAAYDGRLSVPFRRCFLRLCAERALARDDVAAARQAIESLAAVDPTAPEGPEESRATRLFEADLALRAGRPHRAREALARAAAEGAPAGADALEAEWFAVNCTLAINGPHAAAGAIGRALDMLESADAATHGTASRMRCAQRLANLAATACGDAALAKRAYDIAAAAVLLRATEIERAVRDLPELSTPEPEDASTLVAFRRRFAEAQSVLLASVARLLLERVEAGHAPRWSRGLTEGAVGVCAWCLRVRLTDGTMLPLGHFVSSDPSLRISHGMCRDCELQMTASMSASPPASCDAAR